MIPEPERLTAALSALAGVTCWGLFHLATALLSGQPVSRQDFTRAMTTVVFGGIVGTLAGYFVAPAVAPLIPLASLRDLYAVGFGVGAVAWECWPFLYRIAKARLGRTEREQA